MTLLRTKFTDATVAAMKITTETGSYYEIEDGFWSKNGGNREKLWYMYCFDDWPGMSFDDIPEPYPHLTGREDKRLPIQVGKRMKIGNKDNWWVSTRIVSIEGEQE